MPEQPLTLFVIQTIPDLVFTSSNLNQHFAGAIDPGEEGYDL
jgi:hypothetical protein